MKSLLYYFHTKSKILADFQICISVPLSIWLHAEAAIRGALIKKGVFLKISQNSQDNTDTRVSFSIKDVFYTEHHWTTASEFGLADRWICQLNSGQVGMTKEIYPRIKEIFFPSRRLLNLTIVKTWKRQKKFLKNLEIRLKIWRLSQMVNLLIGKNRKTLACGRPY